MSLPPGFPPSENEDFVENKNKPNITFVKRRGRLRLLGDGKDIGGEQLLNDRIAEMVREVKGAEAGFAVTTVKGGQFQRHGVKSTFPDFFRKAGFTTKKDFIRAAERRKGPAFERIVNQAIDDLTKGFSSSFGDVPANKDFLVKTKQMFDNRNVIFRVIDGRVVPLKTSTPRNIIDDDEVPF